MTEGGAEALSASQQRALGYDESVADTHTVNGEGSAKSGADSGAARLIVDRILLENFKSFAGEVVVGPFHENFSAIIGPNGSGKSNIIDAVLFVFGRRASQLRHKKATDLIHKSETLCANKARVVVYFSWLNDRVNEGENAGGGTSEGETAARDKDTRWPAFEISREIQADGKGCYKVNGEVVSSSDMVTFVMEQGIDLDHNRFLILQGEVEQTAMMPAKGVNDGDVGLLELLEDLIGSQKFIPKIRSAEAKIDEQQEILVELDKKLKLAQTQLRASAAPCREALDFVRAQNNLLAATALQLGKEGYRVRRERGATEAEREVEENELKELKELRKKARLEIDELIAKEKKKVDRLERAKAEVARVKQLKKIAHNNLDKHIGAQDALKGALQRAMGEREKQARKAETENSAAKSLEMKMEISKKEEPGLRHELDTLIEREAEVESGLAAQYDELRSMRAAAEAREQAAREEQNQLRKELSALEMQEKALREEIESDSGEKTMEGLRERERSCEANVLQCEKELKMVSDIKSQYEAGEKQYLADLEALQEKENKIRTDLNEISTKIFAMTRSTTGRGRFVLEQRLRLEFEKNESPLFQKGFWLFDKVEVDAKKFGIALSAAGLLSDWVVVESERDATDIIDFVKSHRLGKVQCVLKEKMLRQAKQGYETFKRVRNLDSQRQSAGGELIYLMDLFQITDSTRAEELKMLLFQRVKETAVVADQRTPWEEVVALAKGGYSHGNSHSNNNGNGNSRRRVVTLDGNLVEKNGSQTGGKIDNYFLLRGVPVDIGTGASSLKGLEQTKRGLWEELENVTRKQRSLEARWAAQSLQLSERGAGGNDSALVDRAKMKLASAQSLLQNMRALVEENQRAEEKRRRERQQERPQEQAQKLKLLENCGKELMRKRKREGSLEKGLEGLAKDKDQILTVMQNLGGPELIRLKERKVTLEKGLKECADIQANGVNQIATKLEMARQIVEKVLVELATKIGEIEGKIEEGESRSRDLQERVHAMSHELAGAEAEFKEAEKGAEEGCAILRAAEKDLQELALYERKKVARIQDIDAVIEAFDKKLERIRREVMNVKKDFDFLPKLDGLAALLASAGPDAGADVLGGKALVKSAGGTYPDEMGEASEEPGGAANDDRTMALIDEEEGGDLVEESKELRPGISSSPRSTTSSKTSGRSRGTLAASAAWLSPEELFKNVDDICDGHDSYYAQRTMKEFQLDVYKYEMAVNALRQGGPVVGGDKGGKRTINISVLEGLKQQLESMSVATRSVNEKEALLHRLMNELLELRERRLLAFKEGFRVIGNKTKELYQMLTCGGDAELEFKDPADPFQDGIEFSVRPPKKSWRPIVNLSGGEKTLASLALIFSLHFYRPTPLYFLDEIDAALDPENVLIIASYVAAQQSAGAQFIVVSLRNHFFERSDRLIGVYKVSNRTHTAILDPDSFLAAYATKENSQPKSNSGANAIASNSANANATDGGYSDTQTVSLGRARKRTSHGRELAAVSPPASRAVAG